MAFEETREMQQIYTLFRSCVYLILVIELVMNLPVPSTVCPALILKMLSSVHVFNSVGTCKLMEIICVCITCIGTKARKSLKFSLTKMVVYPLIAGVVLTILCFVVHTGHWGGVT